MVIRSGRLWLIPDYEEAMAHHPDDPPCPECGAKPGALEAEIARLRAALAAAEAKGFEAGLVAAKTAAKNARNLSEEQITALTTGFGCILPATQIFQLGCDTAAGAIRRTLRPSVAPA